MNGRIFRAIKLAPTRSATETDLMEIILENSFFTLTTKREKIKINRYVYHEVFINRCGRVVFPERTPQYSVNTVRSGCSEVKHVRHFELSLELSMKALGKVFDLGRCFATRTG